MEQITKQNVINIKDREQLTLSGVIDIDSFDESCITLITELGTLVLRGNDFRINKLNVDTGELDVSGNFDSLAYSNNVRNREMSLFARIFK